MAFLQNTIAIVYDFDGTLSPQPMQEYTILPELDISGEAFWRACEREAKIHKADKMLTYMRRLVKEIEYKEKNLSRAVLQALGKNISYFKGVKDWFTKVNHYVEVQSNSTINIKHYIVSAGLKEVLNGITIKGEFANIFACEYYFENGVAKFPTVVVNDTSKTQYLFRINKGKEDINQSINEHMPKAYRPIPFSNILYIGDGETDVPCMTLTKENGGFAIAVHKPDDQQTKAICQQLWYDKRIDYYAPADYTSNSRLSQHIELILNSMIANINLARSKYQFKIKEQL